MMNELYLNKEDFEKLTSGKNINILVLNDEKPKVIANLNMSPAVRNDVLLAIKNANDLLERVSISLEVDNYIKNEKKEEKRMIKYIYDMCKENNCTVELHIGQDGAITITVFGKHTDHLIIRADWDEETIKDCINDTIRRVCND